MKKYASYILKLAVNVSKSTFDIISEQIQCNLTRYCDRENGSTTIETLLVAPFFVLMMYATTEMFLLGSAIYDLNKILSEGIYAAEFGPAFAPNNSVINLTQRDYEIEDRVFWGPEFPQHDPQQPEGTPDSAPCLRDIWATQRNPADPSCNCSEYSTLTNCGHLYTQAQMFVKFHQINNQTLHNAQYTTSFDTTNDRATVRISATYRPIIAYAFSLDGVSLETSGVAQSFFDSFN